MATGDVGPDGSDGQAEASASSEPVDEGRSLGADDWEEMAEEWTPRLRAYFGRLRCTPPERDELVQDVLVAAWAAASETPQGDRDEAALIRKLAREASARHKRLMRHEVTIANAESTAIADQARIDAADERLRLWFWLQQVLDRLPERQRVAIERHMDGVPDTQIAEEIGCTEGSVRVLAARGMSTLRRNAPPPDE
jgi:RNA polymerase sigma factor (sigma-70 family)